MIDAHLHIWKADLTFPDPAATTVSPTSDIPVELLEQYMEEFDVDRAVLVQPLYPGEDNQYVVDVANEQPDKFAAVCVVDPRKTDAAATLQHWVDRGAKGLRLRPGVPAESDSYGAESTYPLWECIQANRVVVNVLGGFDFMERTRHLANRYPDVPIILDHMAHPDIAAGPSAWQPMLELAICPNVYVKVSGYPYYSSEAYPFADCCAIVRATWEAFGTDRLIWGSDFPHIVLQTGYYRATQLLDRMDVSWTAQDLRKIQHGNAARLYWGEST